MIFHHLNALSNLRGSHEVKNVFLVGNDNPRHFIPFIDNMLPRFKFNIECIEQDSNRGLTTIIKNKEIAMKDNPDFLFFMTTEICCSFPLYDMLKYHVQNNNMITVLSTI